MEKNMRNETAERLSFTLTQILRPRPTPRKTWKLVGMLVCLLACSPGDSSLQAEAGRKGPLIIPKGALAEESIAGGQPESFDSYQIRVLRNQNQLQAEKIKVLRDELLELTHKLNELKPHLFKQSDPADQARIAELTYQLGKKEEALSGLTTSRRDMEAELNQTRKKITELEVVKDALTDLVDKHRTAKEQSAESFKTQIDDLYATTAQEKNALQKRIQQHEALQEKLNESLHDKTHTIQRLDAVASAQDAALSAKNQELLALEEKTMQLYEEILATSQAYASANALQSQQIATLNDSLISHREKIDQLSLYKEEMQWLSDVFSGSQTLLQDEIHSLKSDLEQEKAVTAELASVKAQLDLHRQELAALLAAHTEAQTQHAHYVSELRGEHAQHIDQLKGQYANAQELQEGYIETLKAQIEQEQAHAHELEGQFLGLLAHQETSQIYADTLKETIGKMDDLLAAKQMELDAMNATHAETVGSLLLHLDETSMAEEHHSGYREALESYLALFYTQRKVNEQSQQDQKDKLVEGHKEAYQVWHERLAALNQAYKQRELELRQRLSTSSTKSEAQASHLQELEQLLNDANLHSAALAEQLNTHQTLLQDKEAQILAIEEARAATYQQLEEKLHVLTAEMEEKQKELDSAQSAHAEATARWQNQLETAHNELASASQEWSQKLETAQSEHAQVVSEWTQKLKAVEDAHETAIAQWKDQLAAALNAHADDQVHSQSQQHQVESALTTEHEKFINLNLAHEHVKKELIERISEIQGQLEEEKTRLETVQEQLLIALAQIELEQGMGMEQSQKAHALAHELEEKIHLLELSHSQASTTHLDNQQLTHQNAELLDQISLLEEKLYKEQHLNQTQNSFVEQLQGELTQAQNSLSNIDELGNQLQALQSHLKKHEEEVSHERAAHAQTRQDHAAKLDELEIYHHNATVGRDSEIMRLKVALHEEKEKAARLREDYKLARLNYHQEHSTLRNLEQIIAEVTARAEAIEDQLAETRLAAVNKDEEHKLLAEAHNELKENFHVLQQSLLADLEKEKSARSALQDQLDRALSLYENALNKKQIADADKPSSNDGDDEDEDDDDEQDDGDDAGRSRLQRVKGG